MCVCLFTLVQKQANEASEHKPTILAAYKKVQRDRR